MRSSSIPPYPRRRRDRQKRRDRQRFLAGGVVTLGFSLALLFHHSPRSEMRQSSAPIVWEVTTVPLVMEGGDPYIRALMRTISASEANSTNPYSLIYGGKRFEDLSHHPDRCVTIVSGPHQGSCTTAAGRYQFITTTWQEKAKYYHPAPPAWYTPWSTYSFEPEYQDQVVYAWLSDPYAWGYDLSTLLRQGDLDFVLQLLSSTWTSLGYGIEDNDMTSALPAIYEEVLQEELQRSQATSTSE